MAGAGLQMTIIIPSHDLVVVRLGHYRGSVPGKDDLDESLRLLMAAVPRPIDQHSNIHMTLYCRLLLVKCK